MRIHVGSVGSKRFGVMLQDPERYRHDGIYVVEVSSAYLPDDQRQISVHINDHNNDLPPGNLMAFALGMASDLSELFPEWVLGQTYPIASGGQIRVGSQDTEYDVDFDGDDDGQFRFDVNIIDGTEDDNLRLIQWRDMAQQRLASLYPLS